ncbi:MAG TPA: hypothetical protein CFH82_03260 [Sulfurospirillum sp. UBA12182]|nr:MAG TPA: hypothetical protein CFH82_03260 [Sulfurospirillum sp. UBA12182]
MPAQNFGKHLHCWKEGGRKACQKDQIFQKMEADMMNLVPAIGELNGDRSNYGYGADKPQIGQYGQCEFQVDFKNKRAYVKDDIKGDIARIYFYMSKTYNINLSKQERQMMEAWDKLDPINEWEIKKTIKINKLKIYSFYLDAHLHKNYKVHQVFLKHAVHFYLFFLNVRINHQNELLKNLHSLYMLE